MNIRFPALVTHFRVRLRGRARNQKLESRNHSVLKGADAGATGARLS
jgi:hypothetical protein